MLSGCGWKSLRRRWDMHLSQARPGLEALLLSSQEWVSQKSLLLSELCLPVGKLGGVGACGLVVEIKFILYVNSLIQEIVTQCRLLLLQVE